MLLEFYLVEFKDHLKVIVNKVKISVLPSLTNSEIISFIELGANKIGYEGFFSGQIPKASLGLDQSELKKLVDLLIYYWKFIILWELIIANHYKPPLNY